MEQLRADVRRDQLASFVRLKGGFPFPLAGAVYWVALGVAGYHLSVARLEPRRLRLLRRDLPARHPAVAKSSAATS